jgi:hypothetical protein
MGRRILGRRVRGVAMTANSARAAALALALAIGLPAAARAE